MTYKPKAQSKGEERSSKQGTLDAVVKSHYCSEAKAKVITDKILMMIALDLRPVRVVEGQGFKDLMKHVEPGYTVPSRKHIGTLLKHKHSLSIEKLKEKLDKEAESVALTTDIWTSVATEVLLHTTLTKTGKYNPLFCKLQPFQNITLEQKLEPK